tara:strand:+ start:7125 stop:8015 length:891 start_codon:yes stop_codon:yes gene_type:complete
MNAASRRAFIAPFAALAIAGSALAAPALRPLDPDTCDVIRRYDAREDLPSFRDQFIHMALGTELCEDRAAYCARDHILRRESGVSFWYLRLRSWEGRKELRRQIGLAMEEAFGVIFDTLEMTPQDDFEIVTSEFDSARFPVIGMMLSDYSERQIALNSIFERAPNFLSPAKRKLLLAARKGCFVLTSEDEFSRGSPSISLIFLDFNLPEELLVRCAKEEVYNAFLPGDPIGDASLFDDPWGREAPADPAQGPGFSERDRALLRLLYTPDLRAGMPRAAMEAAVDHVLARDCGIAGP